VKIFITDIPDDGKEFEGELPGSILSVDDKLVDAKEAIQYRLFLLKATEIVTATGSITASIRAICGRCSEYFPVKLHLKNFAVTVDIQGDEIDLTEEIREEILLRLPIIPKCPLTSKGLCPYSYPFESVRQADTDIGENNEFPDEKSPADVWGVLDQLKNPEE